MSIKIFLKYLKFTASNGSISNLFNKRRISLLLRNPRKIYTNSLNWWDQLQNIYHLDSDNFISPLKESILIFTHEFSFTGIPVLALNLSEYYSKDYNVFVIGFGNGPLLKYFNIASVNVVVPHFGQDNSELMDQLIDDIDDINNIKFAIITTVECYPALPSLSIRYIPSICLINEYAGIYGSKTPFDVALLWSDCIFFSSQFLFNNALNQVNGFRGENSHVLAQGKCAIPLETPPNIVESEFRRNQLKWEQVKSSLGEYRLVLGVGSVNYRKGVDLFIQTAHELSKTSSGASFKYLWVGDGMQHKGVASYPLLLLDEIKKFGLEESFYFIGPVGPLDEIYDAASVLLITSRIDPLPNVAIDVMTRGIPFVYFDYATGINDALKDMVGEEAEFYKAKYLDVKDMAEKACALISDRAESITSKLKDKVNLAYDFNIYGKKLESLYPMLDAKNKQLKNDLEVILRDSEFRLDFFSSDLVGASWPNERVGKLYLKSWFSSMGRRKPFPGLHPGIYGELNGLTKVDGDPFAHYLSSGKPSGPWAPQVIYPYFAPLEDDGATKGNVALHLHIHYPELISDILERLNLNSVRPDLFVSITDKNNFLKIQSELEKYSGVIKQIRVCPNLGRDIGPLITEFGSEIALKYTYFGHIHTKASKYLDSPIPGEIWFRFLLENLLGGHGGAMADNILSTMVKNPDLDLVFPDDPNVIGWDKNRLIAEGLAIRLGIGSLPDNFNFPVGTMFWANTSLLKRLLELNLTWQDYPVEPIGNDGTILHALERLIPFVASVSGGRYALTNVAGITR